MDVTMKSAEGSETRLIKRYANRKLYDTHESRYVTLQQIATFVRDGQDVRIVDNRTKEDLTNVTLAQIIYEEEKSGDSDVRRSSLLTFIQEGRERLITSLPKFPFRSKEEGGKEDEAADAKESKASKGSKEGKGKTALDAALEFRAMADDQVKALVSSAMGHVQQLQGEVRRLQGRIEELEGRLTSLLGRKDSREEDEAGE